MRSSHKNALEFVHLKKTWIQKHLAILEQIENRKKASGTHLQNINEEDAKKQITDRLNHLAGEYGFKCNNVTIRQQKTRWGSCSPKNNISLNMKLVLLPEPLLDYVILHELVHTKVHNHSRKFWAELDRYIKDSKTASKKLRKAGTMLL